MNKTTFLITLFLSLYAVLNAQNKTENLIIITLDGTRWQEVFTGADSLLIRTKEQTKDTAAFLKKYWRNTPEDRRRALMPFLWGTLASQGQIYGNRHAGNLVNVSNHMWFSFPGYSEILCGFADDERINSNNPVNNPNTHVLEFLHAKPAFNGKIATFSSWDAFPFIINEKRSGIPVNSGFEPVSGDNLTENEVLLNSLMRKIPEFIGGVRNDAITFYLGFEYLKKNNPKVLYIALDETDDLAHDSRYDLYLNAISYSDQMIAELWDWIQKSPVYKNKTTLMITVDHGRGIGLSDWKSHGIKIPHSDETWFAVMGPDTPAKGEIKTAGQIYNSQYASTLAGFLGFNYSNVKPVGAKIAEVLSK
ncbi:MAG: LTA synthase family protein [Bacteroidales bacterium]|nr:LTA synthase family protein [Bacteroidales bacterium]